VVQCLRQLAEDGASAGNGAVHIEVSEETIASRVALKVAEVKDILDRLAAARLVVAAKDAGVPGEGYVVPEVGKLLEFLEFLELKDRAG